MFTTNAPRTAPHGNRFDEELRNVMRPGVIVITEEASVTQTQHALLSHGIHAILVLDRAGRPLGWATSSGLLEFSDRDTGLLSARDAVTEPALTLAPSASVRDALALMSRERVPRVVVALDSDRIPEGVVAEHDLLRVMTR
jgi:CBS domain-containing protein